jgi:hypothetical protein
MEPLFQGRALGLSLVTLVTSMDLSLFISQMGQALWSQTLEKVQKEYFPRWGQLGANTEDSRSEPTGRGLLSQFSVDGSMVDWIIFSHDFLPFL